MYESINNLISSGKILKNSPFGYALHKIILDSSGNTIDYEFLDVNTSFEIFTGIKASFIINKKVTEAIPLITKDDFNWIQFYGKIALGETQTKEFEQFSEALGKWYKVHAYSPDKYFFVTLFADITDEKNIIEEKSEKLLETSIFLSQTNEMAKIGGWKYDIEKEVLYWTEQTYIIHELDFSYIPTPSNAIMFYKEGKSREQIWTVFNKCINEQIAFDAEYELVTAKGRDLWVRSIGKPVFKDGKLIQIAGTIQDITNKKKSEKDLQILYEKLKGFKFAINQASIISKTDIEGYIIYANDNFCRVSKYSKAELIGSKHNIINSKYHSNEYWTSMWDIITSGKIWRGEVRNQAKDGKYYWVDTYIVPIKNNEGEIYEYLSVRNEISDKKKMEEALVRTLETLNETQKIAHIGRWDYDIQNNKLIWSEGACQIFEISPEEQPSSYEAFLRYVHPEDLQRVNETYIDSIQNKKEYKITHRIITKNAAIKWLSETCRTDYNEEGEPIRSIGTVQDITALKEVELSLIQAKKNAEAAVEVKSQFLASMSHEIRTPLNSVIGFANILEKTYLQPLQRKYLNNITTSAQTLLDIISDILDFSKMEAGKLELESIATDINVFLSDVLDMILFSVNKKNLEFILDVPPDFPDQIHIDRLRLKQVLINLLSNAVKFTERGKIELALRYRLLEEENRVIVKFWVKDSGIGISKENQLKLFQPFTQTDSSITRKYGGTGLGLVISKMILNEMGSNLFLLSKETVGSKFYFSFQTQCKYEDKKTQFSIIKEIHLIGNSTKNNKILNNLLRYHNIQLTYHNEKEGLDFLKNSNSLNIFLIDYNSLNLNGETFLTELTRYLNDNIVTILIHKNNDYETLNFNKLFHKNFYHLTKPLQSKEIIDLLKKIEAALSSQEERISSQESLQIDYESLIINRDENILILLVDDVELNMILLKEFIKLYLPNAEIIEAVNGQDAIEMYETYLPEFVFMDIQMPIVDGYKATREIRIFENQVGREHIPIVALTAGVRDNEVELCQEAGMSDFLKKPINQAQLQDLLRIYFKN